jgi:hypothetical protein
MTALEAVRERLWNGEALRVLFAEDVGFDVWVEKYGNPPRVYFEGRALPLEEFDAVVASVGRYLAEEGIRFVWNGRIPDIRMPQGAA